MNGTFYDVGYYNLEYGEYPSSRAVDGNKDPLAFQMNNSCVHSEWHANPWWAVDLGAALYVIGVLFTNRAEGFGNVDLYLHVYTVNKNHCILVNNFAKCWPIFEISASVACSNVGLRR